MYIVSDMYIRRYFGGKMINEKYTKSFCNNYTEIENYQEAVNDTSQTWDCHHKKEITESKSRQQLIKEGLYYNRPPEELIFLTRTEHTKAHMIGKHFSEEVRKRMSESIKRSRTPELRKRISESMKKSITPEFRKRMSESMRLYWLKKKSKI